MKRLFNIVLLALLCCVVSATGFAQTAEFFSGGSGTEQDPYQISTPQDFAELARRVNGKINGTAANSFHGKYIVLTSDLDMSGIDTYPIGVSTTSVETDMPFSGTLDAKGHKIYNLTLGDMARSMSHIAPFAYTDKATIQNLRIEASSFRGSQLVGGIVAQARESTIQDCSIAADVTIVGTLYAGGIAGSCTRSTITRCINYAPVICRRGNANGAGGIAGESNGGDISYCANYGDIHSSLNYAGGIVGITPPNIPEIGIIIDNKPIRYCFNMGDVTATMDGAGGILGGAGWQPAGPTTPKKVFFEGCYNVGQVITSSQDKYAPICGVTVAQSHLLAQNTYYDKELMTTPTQANAWLYEIGQEVAHSVMVGNDFVTMLNVGDATAYVQDIKGTNGGYPILKWMTDDALKTSASMRGSRTNTSLPLRYVDPMKVHKEWLFTFEDEIPADFLIKQPVLQSPRVSLKARGFRKDRAWVLFSMDEATAGSPFLASTSFFKRPNLLEPGGGENVTKPATNWIIFPSVWIPSGGTTELSWVAASQDEEAKDGYRIYIQEGSSSLSSPADFTSEPVYSNEGEEAFVVNTFIDKEGEEQTTYTPTARKVEIKGFGGKQVRIAIEHNSYDKFVLMIGDVKIISNSQETSLMPLVDEDKPFVLQATSEGITIDAQGSAQVEVFDTTGRRVAVGQNILNAQLTKGLYIVRITYSDRTYMSKVIIG